MKGLIWVVAFVVLGVAAGATAFAFTPARYRAITALQVTVHRPNDSKIEGLARTQIVEMLHVLFSEKWVEQRMLELDLYERERDAGRWADALLQFRRSMTFSRSVESDISERWTVAFEAEDPKVAEKVTSKLASRIVEEVQEEDDGFPGNAELLLQHFRSQLRALESEMKTWSDLHPGTMPPVEMANSHRDVHGEYLHLLGEVDLSLMDRHHFFRPLNVNIQVVRTPRVSDGQLRLSVQPYAIGGGAAGLFVGLFAMPPFFWWRRHLP